MTLRHGPRLLRRRLAAGLVTAAALAGGPGLLGACGSAGNAHASPTASGSDQVLPVAMNPITNTATTEAFTIDSVLVENNEDASGAAVDDHLEITVTNASDTELSGFEVFYRYHDPITDVSESYYAALPASFTIAAGATRVIHFDDTGTADHFAVNAYSLYYTDLNALDVTVEVSADGAAPQTTTVQKDAGGAEVPD